MSNFKKCPWCGNTLNTDIPDNMPFLHDGYVIKDHRLLGYYGDPRDRVLLLPDVAESISQDAVMSDRTLFTTIIVPEGVKVIENSCFAHCSNLTSITLPNTLERIGANAFDKCCSLEELHIPDSVTDIGPHFIETCDALSSITLPPNVRISNWLLGGARVKNVVLTQRQMDDVIERALKFYGNKRKKEGTDNFCPFGYSTLERIVVSGTSFTVDDIVEKLQKRNVTKSEIFRIISGVFIWTPMLEKSKFYQLQKELRVQNFQL